MRLSYLDAFVPENGQSNLEMQTPERMKIIEAAVARSDVSRPVPRGEDFAIADPAHTAWVNAKMTPAAARASRFRRSG